MKALLKELEAEVQRISYSLVFISFLTENERKNLKLELHNILRKIENINKVKEENS